MNRYIRKGCFIILILLGIGALSLKAEDLKLNLDIESGNHVQVKLLKNGKYQIITTGEDPYIYTKSFKPTYDPKKEYIFSFDYLCIKGLSGIQLFYGPPISAKNSAEGPEVLSSEGWTSYSLNIKICQNKNSWRKGYTQFRIDFGRKAGRTIQLQNIKLRVPNAAEKKAAIAGKMQAVKKIQFDEKLKNMLESNYDSIIERVEADKKFIKIAIHVRDMQVKQKNKFFLCEVPFYQSPIGRKEFVSQIEIFPKFGEQKLKIERFRGNHDRVFSSWIIMEEGVDNLVPDSHQKFVENISQKWKLKRDKPKSKKGCTGLLGGNKFQYDDYKALGIHNATKNIMLPNLIATKREKNTLPHKFNGKIYHIRTAKVDALDKAMQEMDQLEIVVSAIILISKNTPMSHPDCAPQGIYAMANVVEKDGWNIYAAGLDFLAQRYMRPDRKYGRITHWILHNEVDAGWVWTNAGNKPLHTYMDLMYRSMRTAQSVIRRYGSAGQVLLSLTHHWTKSHNSRCYQPKQMIDLLAKRCSVEGNFDWGLAYHPYPQNLRDPRTWEDKQATFDFETNFITPKNLEVLDAYMKQKSMLYDGKVRTVVLSEQGSNSPDYSEKSFQDQAAGLVYTWVKFKDMDSIESFIHHRWKDHPKEGGLKLGLRKQGDDTDPEATRKPAWDVYRKLGTSEDIKAFEFAKPIIGIKDISEVHYKGKIQ